MLAIRFGVRQYDCRFVFGVGCALARDPAIVLSAGRDYDTHFTNTDTIVFGMRIMTKAYSNAKPNGLEAADALAPYKNHAWLRLAPAERLRRAWRLRQRIPDLRAIHDQKIFPRLDGE